MNPYEVLCVERDANEKTIKAAYRELARKWHPDSLKDEEAMQHAKKKMQEINEAFDILKKKYADMIIGHYPDVAGQGLFYSEAVDIHKKIREKSINQGNTCYLCKLYKFK